jgi:hypothetical protein
VRELRDAYLSVRELQCPNIENAASDMAKQNKERKEAPYHTVYLDIEQIRVRRDFGNSGMEVRLNYPSFRFVAEARLFSKSATCRPHASSGLYRASKIPDQVCHGPDLSR